MALRNTGISGAVVIDGKVYMSLGATAAGTPMRVARLVMKVRAEIDVRRDHKALAAELAGIEQEHAEAAAGPGNWEPYVGEDVYGFRKNDLLYQLGELT